jgi:hypothetical protein
MAFNYMAGAGHHNVVSVHLIQRRHLIHPRWKIRHVIKYLYVGFECHFVHIFRLYIHCPKTFLPKWRFMKWTPGQVVGDHVVRHPAGQDHLESGYTVVTWNKAV